MPSRRRRSNARGIFGKETWRAVDGRWAEVAGAGVGLRWRGAGGGRVIHYGPVTPIMPADKEARLD